MSFERELLTSLLCLSILLLPSLRYEYAKRKYVADPLLAQFLLFDTITTYTSRLSIDVLLTYPEVHYLGHDGTEVHGASRHVYRLNRIIE